MSDDADLQQQILRRTLQEVAQEQQEEKDVVDLCVICLDAITEPAVAVPCDHANFDFLCLVSWLEQRRNCPLCKSDISSVKYNLENPHGPKIYHLPAIPPSSTGATAGTSPYRLEAPFHRSSRRPRRPRSPPAQSPDDPLRRRQHVYRNQLYSLRVGSNRISQYRELTPEMFNHDEELVSRARKWIRRELQVFEFLNPDSAADTNQSQMARAGQQRLQSRRGNNAEFLLEYIIAILRTVDIKGSAGQAEELLRDFLGRDNATLFLHELQAWLRSPYMSLEDWDRHVQYDDTPTQRPRHEFEASDRTSTPVYRNSGPTFRGRVAKPRYSRGPRNQGRARDPEMTARRVQYARDRYVPD
ncbi:hypothetical protein ARAM_006604 [Aspergillus rambellii]|uniref:RING-type E3 ubiquitin transferase n=1 Tax=Aspergillus rambellii TaxID=308745 RepID=A0A0F8UU27_9EURO|nr:hypothetical protein ARAM_006604 [Aspergillus rambellii]